MGSRVLSVNTSEDLGASEGVSLSTQEPMTEEEQWRSTMRAVFSSDAALVLLRQLRAAGREETLPREHKNPEDEAWCKVSSGDDAEAHDEVSARSFQEASRIVLPQFGFGTDEHG